MIKIASIYSLLTRGSWVRVHMASCECPEFDTESTMCTSHQVFLKKKKKYLVFKLHIIVFFWSHDFKSVSQSHIVNWAVVNSTIRLGYFHLKRVKIHTGLFPMTQHVSFTARLVWQWCCWTHMRKSLVWVLGLPCTC